MSITAPAMPLPPSVVAEAYAWWKGQLNDWICRFLNTRSIPTDLSKPDITICRDEILAGDSGIAFSLVHVSDALQSLNASTRLRNRTLHIRLRPDRFVIRRLGENRIPLARAYGMAELDISANTPFALDDVYILFADREGSVANAEYVLVRRDIIDPVFEAMKGSRYRTGLLSFESNSGLYFAQPYVLDFFSGQMAGLIRWLRKRFFPVTAAGAVALTIFNLSSFIENATAKVDVAINSVEPAANKAREEFRKRADHIAHLQQLSKERREYTPMTRIVEELTRIIPDDTFLTDFRLQKQKIQISGFSASAAQLIALIDASPLFKGPRFTSAVIKVPGRDGEQFNIELELEHAG